MPIFIILIYQTLQGNLMQNKSFKVIGNVGGYKAIFTV